MAELSKIFKTNDLYEAWRNNKDIPSNVLAVVLNETGEDVEKVAFGTNDITGKYETYEVEKAEPKDYANNNNVYVCNGTYRFQYNSTCMLLKANIWKEFDWPLRENDIYTEPFEFTLYGINGEVDIEQVALFWGLKSGETWTNFFENNKKITWSKMNDGSYKCFINFDDDRLEGENFFLAYKKDPLNNIIGYWTD